jgi:membrane protein
MSFLLGRQQEDAARTVTGLFDVLLPRDSSASTELLRSLVADVLRTRGAVTIYSAIIFAWFSTRLFGSLRSVLALIFDGTDRGIVAGKLFDFLATIVATVAVVVYVVLSFYLDMATTQGLALLVQFGVRESAMSNLTYFAARFFALAVVVGLFYALYRGLPRRRPTLRTALVGATTAGLLFELVRYLYAMIVARTDPSSLYAGTIAAVVSVVFWTYYGALVFLAGAEVAQAYDLRRGELALRQHREAPDHEVPGTALPDRAASQPHMHTPKKTPPSRKTRK